MTVVSTRAGRHNGPEAALPARPNGPSPVVVGPVAPDGIGVAVPGPEECDPAVAFAAIPFRIDVTEEHIAFSVD